MMLHGVAQRLAGEDEVLLLPMSPAGNTGPVEVFSDG